MYMQYEKIIIKRTGIKKKKATVLYDSIYMKHLKCENSQRQKADQWCPGDGEREKQEVIP